MWRRNRQFSNLLGHHEYLSCSTGTSPKFLDAVCKGYKSKSLLAKIAAQPSHYPQFTEKNGLLYTKNRGNEEVLCLPHVMFKGDSIIAQIINGAHKALGHFSAQRTADYIRRKYW
ncbi:hypothetical protein OG21DRAFT_1426901, partial [Imleria badia]